MKDEKEFPGVLAFLPCPNTTKMSPRTPPLLKRLDTEQALGIALDLRKNGGGFFQEAVALTGLFIPQGPVVQVQNYAKQKKILEDEDPSTIYDGPLVVMVINSVPLAEITAAALQDYQRAVIVGDQSTMVKGTVQTPDGIESLQGHSPAKWHAQIHYSKILSHRWRNHPEAWCDSGCHPAFHLRLHGTPCEANLPRSLEPDIIDAVSYQSLDRVKPIIETSRRLPKFASGRTRTFNTF